ncbi:MAG: LamG-like jellyroll fold domain-containing protein [Thermoguttaceae bacterium]
MNSSILFLTLFSVAAPPVETSPTPTTRLYVRTIPPGAEVRLDGKPAGKSDDLFMVPAGVQKMTIEVELDGHYPERQEVQIGGGRITRVELKMLSRTVTASEKPAVAAKPDSSFVAASNHLDLGDTATIETWVRFDALPDNSFATLLGKDEGRYDQNKWIFAYARDFAGIENAICFHINSPTTGATWVQSNSWTPVIGQWYHLAVVKNGKQYTFYRDGRPDGTAETTAAVPRVNSDLLLGQAEGRFRLHGAMSDVRLWNIALTANQIQTGMNKELTGKETGLAGHWIDPGNSGRHGRYAATPPHAHALQFDWDGEPDDTSP